MRQNIALQYILLTFLGTIIMGVEYASAVEIPLGMTGTLIYSSGTVPSMQGTAGAIGYVDIDRVFREHPLTRRSRDEFKQEVEKRRKAIDAMQQSIADTEKTVLSSTTIMDQERAEVESLRSQPSQAPAKPQPLSLSTTEYATIFPDIAQSTSAAVSPDIIRSKETSIKTKEADLEKMKGDLAAMKADIAIRLQKDKEDLTRLEEKQTSDVMADIYYVLEKIAKEENITVVFDKNNILYGQSVQDITDKTLERLKGR